MPNPSDKPVPFRIRTDEVSKTVSFVFDPAPVIFPMNASQARAVAKKLNEKADIVDPPAKRKRTKAQPVEPPSLPSWLSEELWGRWVAHRIEIKEPMTHSMMAASLRTMEKLRALGQDIEAVIDSSIAGGYQGLFELKGALAAPVAQQPPPTDKPEPDISGCVKCFGAKMQVIPGKGAIRCGNDENPHDIKISECVAATPEQLAEIEASVKKLAANMQVPYMSDEEVEAWNEALIH